jgi:hypothetical protein
MLIYMMHTIRWATTYTNCADKYTSKRCTIFHNLWLNTQSLYTLVKPLDIVNKFGIGLLELRLHVGFISEAVKVK